MWTSSRKAAALKSGGVRVHVKVLKNAVFVYFCHMGYYRATSRRGVMMIGL